MTATSGWSCGDNDNFETTATRVYGPEGLVSDLTHLQDKYYALNYLITTPEGQAAVLWQRQCAQQQRLNV